DFQNPTDIGTLGVGTNTLTAGQQGEAAGRDIDYVTFEVAEGQQLSAINLVSYDGGDAAAFLGLVEGAAFPTDASSTQASDLLGGVTYGDAQEGSDILDDIGGLQGATGFSGPLGAGTYTIWLNQTGPASTTSLEFIIEEATSAPMLSLGDVPNASTAVVLTDEEESDVNAQLLEGGATIDLANLPASDVMSPTPAGGAVDFGQDGFEDDAAVDAAQAPLPSSDLGDSL
ncbi:MAG: hypothetical protein AAFQ67_08035, partial [Pseudomonadota bacterium]